MPEKEFKPQNTVFLEGFLKENTLEMAKSKSTNVPYIKGYLVIATSEVESYKISFLVSETKTNGDKNEEYEKLLDLLPNKTTTIANFLKASEKATFEVAANASTKVWAMGRFEEYAVVEDKRERSSILIKGNRAGIKTATDKSPFKPRANFSLDVYIENKYEEINDSGEKTGRLLIDGLFPSFRGGKINLMQKITFVVEGSAVKEVDSRYNTTQTVLLKGNIRSLQQQVAADEVVEDDGSWGSAAETHVKTTFIRERVITGGGLAQDAGTEFAFSKEDVKNGLEARKAVVRENTDRKATAPAKETKVEEAAAEAKEVKKADAKGDFEFDDGDF